MKKHIEINTLFVTKDGYSIPKNRLSIAQKCGTVRVCKENELIEAVKDFIGGELVVIIVGACDDELLLNVLHKLRADDVYAMVAITSQGRSAGAFEKIKAASGATLRIMPCEIKSLLLMLATLNATAKFEKDELLRMLGFGEALYFASAKGNDVRAIRREVSRTLMLRYPAFSDRSCELVGMLAPSGTGADVFDGCFTSFQNCNSNVGRLTYGGVSGIDEVELFVLCR
ncbi:MAG: hypothetical protein IJE25_09390 [Clostridia bacterium]|nr:hypothetical protein [Clostridia bacterium]